MADHRPKNQAESIDITGRLLRVGFFSVISGEAGIQFLRVFGNYPGCRLEFILRPIEGPAWHFNSVW